MKRIFAVSLVFGAFATSAQTFRFIPRFASFVQPTTASAPTANPFPPSASTCGVGCQGQSTAVPAALYLNGCTNYQITLCGDGGTLSGGGTVRVFYFPELSQGGQADGGWYENLALKETVTVSSGTQCQSFQAHVALGSGWIDPVPNAVTVSAGVVQTQVDAVCAN